MMSICIYTSTRPSSFIIYLVYLINQSMSLIVICTSCGYPTAFSHLIFQPYRIPAHGLFVGKIGRIDMPAFTRTCEIKAFAQASMLAASTTQGHGAPNLGLSAWRTGCGRASRGLRRARHRLWRRRIG